MHGVRRLVQGLSKPLAVLLVATGAMGGASAVASRSQAAKSTSVAEHVTLKLVKRTGSTKLEHRGRATGTVAGPVRSVIMLSHSVVLRGTVTISTSRGKLRLKVDGRARTVEVRSRFNGSATIVGGTGRYASSRGEGTFQGVVNRSTWAVTIDATGSFTS